VRQQRLDAGVVVRRVITDEVADLIYNIELRKQASETLSDVGAGVLTILTLKSEADTTDFSSSVNEVRYDTEYRPVVRRRL
jgi:hypothetical protein